MNLTGKVALVTGGAKRVGRAITLALARRGTRVIVHFGRSRAEADGVVKQARAAGTEAWAVQAELTDPDEVTRMFDEALRLAGRLDVLVNNAAVFSRTPLDTLSVTQWDTTLAVNLKAPFLCCQRAAKEMLARDGGKIVNIADWAAIRPYAHHLPYVVSKAGLVALTTALARELAPRIQVNAVAPGPVLLPEWYDEKERDAVIRGTPLKRLGAPEDIAAAVLFLVEGSDFITGSVLPVDGGRLIA